MKVLHLPTNIASQASITVRALRDIGVDARGLVHKPALTQDSMGLETYPEAAFRQQPVRSLGQRLRWWSAAVAAIRWADVVHWHFSTRALPANLDLALTAALGKARLVEFWGSDVRIPEIAAADNAYWAQFYREHPALARTGAERSRQTQDRFSRFGFQCLAPGPETESYIQRDLFPTVHRTRTRLLLSELVPRFPDPHASRPLLVHAPSNKAVKGTEIVLRAIEQLRAEHEFEFKLIHGMEHRKALEIVGQCDIMIDQMMLGAHGLAALEAMALGKPTVCYIKPAMATRYAADLPLVNADGANLASVLAELLSDGQRRHSLGRQGRAYVERYHDAHAIARQLAALYRELLDSTTDRETEPGSGGE